MEINEKIAATGVSDEKFAGKSKVRSINLFYIRITVCIIIFGGVMFLKLNNPCVFENFRFWYQNNVCEEKFNVNEMKKTAVSLFFTAREKVLNIISKFK